MRHVGKFIFSSSSQRYRVVRQPRVHERQRHLDRVYRWFYACLAGAQGDKSKLAIALNEST